MAMGVRKEWRQIEVYDVFDRVLQNASNHL
jgi:hypothetical protein